MMFNTGGFLINLNSRIPCDEEYPTKCSCAPVKECHNLVELGIFKIAIQNCGAYYSRKIEQYKLYRDHDLDVYIKQCMARYLVIMLNRLYYRIASKLGLGI